MSTPQNKEPIFDDSEVDPNQELRHGSGEYWGIGYYDAKFIRDIPQYNRKPNGQEPGLKTLKRIACSGSEYTKAYYFGYSSLMQPNEYADPVEFQQEQELKRQEHEEEMTENAKRISLGEPIKIREVDINQIDSRDMHPGLPVGRRGLAGFELFMRHCEIWRLDAEEQLQ